MLNITSHVSPRHITKPDTREFKNFLYQKFTDLNLRKTDTMDLNPSWVANSHSATQEFPNILHNLEVH
jgi:hypothetical protein